MNVLLLCPVIKGKIQRDGSELEQQAEARSVFSAGRLCWRSVCAEKKRAHFILVI